MMQQPVCEPGSTTSSVVLCRGSYGAAGEFGAVRGIIEVTVGQVFSILPEDLWSVSRGRARVALARQVAMYLSHVVCGLTLTEVGRLYVRDRTTVGHACGVVEDLRDDATFDRVLDLVETIVRFRLQTIELRGVE